jgi:hypothetical protein
LWSLSIHQAVKERKDRWNAANADKASNNIWSNILFGTVALGMNFGYLLASQPPSNTKRQSPMKELKIKALYFFPYLLYMQKSQFTANSKQIFLSNFSSHVKMSGQQKSTSPSPSLSSVFTVEGNWCSKGVARLVRRQTAEKNFLFLISMVCTLGKQKGGADIGRQGLSSISIGSYRLMSLYGLISCGLISF